MNKKKAIFPADYRTTPALPKGHYLLLMLLYTVICKDDLFSFIFSCLLVLMCVFQVLNFTLMCEKKILPKVKFSRKPNVSKSLKPYNVWKIFGKRSHLEVLKPRANIYEIWTWKYKLNFKSGSQRRNFPAYWPAVIHFDLIKNGDLNLRGTFCPMRSPAYNDDWTVLRKSNQSLLNL